MKLDHAGRETGRHEESTECYSLMVGREEHINILLNDEFHNSHSTPNAVRVIMSRVVCWAGNVVRRGKQAFFV